MSEMAILMAAGLGIRMRPLTDNVPKPLIKVHGRPMIESIIEGLKYRGVKSFIVVVGYLGEQFKYLESKYNNLKIIENKDYQTVNNISSINAVADDLIRTRKNVFICEADLYISDNRLFDVKLNHSCYFGKMIEGHTDDWVFDINEKGHITRVGKGGSDCFSMVGISWFSSLDARLLGRIIKDTYGQEGYEELFWDDVVNEHLDKLNLIVTEISSGQLIEIDTLEELMVVDDSYMEE